jgi:uncharacterized membrane protein YfcA
MDNEFLLVGLIFLFASFTQGYAGFAFQLISLSALSFIWNITDAIPVCAMFGLVINIYVTYKMRTYVSLRAIKPLIISSLFGIPIGIYFLTVTSIAIIKISLGIIIFIFVFITIADLNTGINLNSKWGYFFGLISGILGGVLNTNGPPILIYLWLTKVNANQFKAMISTFFLFSSIAIVTGHFITGISSGKTFFLFFNFIPFVLIGQFAGVKLFQSVDSKYYRKFILLILLLISIKLLF